MINGLPPSFSVKRLRWTDEGLGTIAFPAAAMDLRASFGSGLTRSRDDPPGMIWAVGDRGPNIKIKTMIDRYGAAGLKRLAETAGAKIMPRLDLGPAIARLRVDDDAVELVASYRLTDAEGRPVSGLPMPHTKHAAAEPAFDPAGNPIAPDPSGLDTEGIAVLPDGGFLVGDEFGPSLVLLDREGRVLTRLVPANLILEESAYPVRPILPAIASKRQLNRGFEALAISADGLWLFLAFQSPLAHPDVEAHEQARHVRLWKLDLSTFEVVAQFLYPLDPPISFRRDHAADSKLGWSDLKVSELAALEDGGLLVLERASQTTKIYRVTPSADHALGAEHLDIRTVPTVEVLSGDGAALPAVDKQLLFSSDDAPEVAADLEGMAILSETELLLVNDNDFGVEGAETSFWKIVFDEPVLR